MSIPTPDPRGTLMASLLPPEKTGEWAAGFDEGYASGYNTALDEVRIRLATGLQAVPGPIFIVAGVYLALNRETADKIASDIFDRDNGAIVSIEEIK